MANVRHLVAQSDLLSLWWGAVCVSQSGSHEQNAEQLSVRDAGVVPNSDPPPDN